MAMSQKELRIVRDLARRVAEIAADPIQARTIELWKKLNRLQRVRPLIMLQDGTGHETGSRFECICQDPVAREHEAGLRGQIYHWEQMRDDWVWEDTIYSPVHLSMSGYGIVADATRPDHVFGAAHFNTVISEKDSPERIPMPTITVDWEQTEKTYQQYGEIYDGILKVQKRGMTFQWYAPMDTFITWRGIEQTMTDMVDRPEWVKAWMNRMCEFHLEEFRQYEKLNLLSLNNKVNNVGPGGLGYTDLLPQKDFDPGHVRAIDQWGHATTQIFSEVSPAMHEEFGLFHEKRYCAMFGYVNYGCCEPLHNKVELILRHIPNCRRMSMSPKADVAKGAEVLGKRAIFSYKPNPAWLGMPTWDAEFVRACMREAFEKTRGNVVEVIMKDLHTVCGEVRRMSDWIKISKELAEEYA